MDIETRPTLGIRYRVDFIHASGEEDYEICWASNELDATQVAKHVWGEEVTIVKVRRCTIQDIE